MEYKPTTTYTLIYVYTIDDENHKGLLKIGKASLGSSKSENDLNPCCDELNQAALKRIKQQVRTALVENERLIYTELAIRHIKMSDGTDRQEDFTDDDIHRVLKRSGYQAVKFKDSQKDSEWYKVDLETVKLAIREFKKGFMVIQNNNLIVADSSYEEKFKLRREQEENVEKTLRIFETQDKMLWDCKMRYGKTVTAYELIKRGKFQKVIVITHRPAVEDSWDTDHELVFKNSNHKFIDKSNSKLDDYSSEIDSKNDKLLSDYEAQGIPFTYFASIQDLRGSKRVGGKYNKNNKVFDIKWDLLIIDEAHEGTQTDLGENVIKALIKEDTKVLSLTGTAYGLLKDYGDNVFTWTYVDEQKAKREWEDLYPFEKNPYEDLPSMNILTFDLTDKIENSYRYVTTDSAFNFREFFRVWTGDIRNDYSDIPKGCHIGEFVHEDAVISFLNLISKDDEESNYPFSNQNYRDMFKHTFWVVPGVKEAKALSKLLKIHPVFCNYKVVNVAGDGDEEENYNIALKAVREAIRENDKTITLSCGRLTTGITVREWTAIMVLTGSSSTSVNSYMQAIFRVQSPGVIDGKRKENCYVFDFAPDRALKILGEVHKLSSKNRIGNDEERRAALGEFLNFCPVIAVDGTKMQEYDVASMMRQIKKISVESAINSGFDDDTIYLSDAGINKEDIDEEILTKLANVLTPKKKGLRDKKVIIAENGLTDEERRKLEKIHRKAEIELTPEEKALKEKEKEARKQQKILFDLLRAVSIRLPLLFFGAQEDITEIIKLEDFVKIVDDESWNEFLPQGLSKNLFLAISKYYDKDVLVGAGLRIRRLAKAADEYTPNIRTSKILEIISKFKNPDKETVLTPWYVVNLHLSETLGGYSYWDENNIELDEPRFIKRGDITKDVFYKEDAKILEINSKSGLYPLYVANTLYNMKINENEENKSIEELKEIWKNIIEENIYAICKTKMARSITIRTLSGYMKINTNAIYLTKLVTERMKDVDRLSKKIRNPEIWGKKGDRMNFDAIVGNPPYQGNNHQQIYTDFYLTSIKLGKYVSLIFPTGWQQPKSANNLGKLNNEVVKNDKQIMFIDNRQNVFPGIPGAEWVNIILWKKEYDNNLNGMQLVYTNGKNPVKTKLLCKKNEIEKPEQIKKLFKLVKDCGNFKEMQSITSTRKPYGIGTDAFKDLIKYNLESIYDVKKSETDITIYGSKGEVKYVPRDYKLPKISQAFKKFKVFVPYAWGNMSEETGLGGAYSDIIIARPYEICTETFQESGCFDTYDLAEKHAKYLMTKFVRALLYLNKYSQHTTTSWGAVPIQDYSESWWNLSIKEINKKLFEKYKVSDEIFKFVENNIQYRDEVNILNYK